LSEEAPPSPEEVKKTKEILEKLHGERKKEEKESLAKTKEERARMMQEAASALEKHVEEKAKKVPPSG
ncbi:MAG: hypothetical protein KIH04_10260, partial [Candidatus Freyarchaeota archaeon]|nr:hypothetical protein [Candidatus Jordarchaeia archaeon]